jgi:hypothetical protein
MGIEVSPAFFSALYVLAINDASGRTCFVVGAFATLNIEGCDPTCRRGSTSPDKGAAEEPWEPPADG